MATQKLSDPGVITVKPDPDPTILTTENLRREIGNLKESVDTRLDLNDKAITLVQTATEKTRVESNRFVKEEITHLHDLMAANIEVLEKVTSQRFASIETQFEERDKRTEQLSLADKTAIAAALQAQKEAAGAQNESNALSVAKQEAAFTKLLDQNQILFQNSIASINATLTDLKSRIDKGEGGQSGMVSARTGYRDDRSDDRHAMMDSRSMIFGILGTVIGMGALVITVLSHLLK